MMDLSPAALIFVHVIGIVGVFAAGYHLGQRKTEIQPPPRVRRVR